MNCGFDIGCYFEPAVTLWQTIVGIWTVWWPVALFDAGMFVGAILGPKIVLAINTLGGILLVYDRFKPVPEPDYETGEPTSLQKTQTSPPKKPKGIFGDLVARKR